MGVSQKLLVRHASATCAAVLLFVLFPFLARAQSQHLVTLDDLTSQMKFVGQYLELSPDDETLAYSIENDDSLWLLNVKARTSRTLGQGFLPRWSPDGTKLAFYSTRSGTLQLWILDLKTDTSAQVTNLEGGIDPDPVAGLSGSDEDPLRYCWSPDGTRMVFASRTHARGNESTRISPSNGDGKTSPATDLQHQPEGTPIVLTKTTPPEWTDSGLFRYGEYQTALSARGPGSGTEADSSGKFLARQATQLFTVNIVDKRMQQLTNDDRGYFTPDWAPDGTKIVFMSSEGRPITGYGPDTTNLYVMQLADRKETLLTSGVGQKRLPSYSPDGNWISYLGCQQFEQAAAYVVSSTGGTPISVTEQLDRNVRVGPYWSPDSHALFVSYQDGVSILIGRVSTADGKLQRLFDDHAFRAPFTVSRAGSLIWVQADGTSSEVIYRADSEGRNTGELLDLNPKIREWALGKQEVVTWKNGRGDELEGILIKPVGYQQGKSYPLIVDPYPGLANGFMGGAMSGNQAFASRGYAVFFARERTAHTWENPTHGDAFNKATRGPQGADIMMDDLMSGIDAVVKMGVADPNRMCLYGFSNGGGATNLIVTRTSRFKCAVSASGVMPDWTTAFFLIDPGTFVKLIGGVAPWEDPGAYIKLSPVYHLDKVTTPMLLAAGDKETSGAFMALEMYTGLRYLGREVTFLRYPNQGHGFEGAALKDYWKRANTFFDFYLHPEPPSIERTPVATLKQ